MNTKITTFLHQSFLNAKTYRPCGSAKTKRELSIYQRRVLLKIFKKGMYKNK